MGETKIEWATHTANWQSGCTRASPACQHCYAEIMSARQEAMAYARGDERLFNRYEGTTENRRWTGKITFDTDALSRAFAELWRARAPRRVFCGSMTDLFHDDAPPEALAMLAVEIRMADHPTWPHTIMLLTKRPENLARWQREYFPGGLPSWVWVGTTGENQEWVDRRVSELVKVRADVRYLSMEPLLGGVDLNKLWCHTCETDEHVRGPDDKGSQPWCVECDSEVGCANWLDACASKDQPGISWVIVGGESGHGARPMHPQWVRSLRDQCVEAGVPFFFKQWGEWGPRGSAAHCLVVVDQSALEEWHEAPETLGYQWMYRVGKRASGRLLDGRTWDEIPGSGA